MVANRAYDVGLIKARYPFMWAVGMVAAGQLADVVGRKKPIVIGMLVQAAGLAAITDAAHRPDSRWPPNPGHARTAPGMDSDLPVGSPPY